jgi:hypothetical protein
MEQKYIDNLSKLRDFLMANKVEFNMKYFRENEEDGECQLTLDEIEEGTESCGTAGCAVGWAPFVIPPKPEHFDSVREINFWNYVSDSLIPNHDSAFNYRIGNQRSFSWMFGTEWYGVDNSREGAAYRIDHYLKRGIPEEFTEADEMSEIEVEEYMQARDAWLTEQRSVA